LSLVPPFQTAFGFGKDTAVTVEKGKAIDAAGARLHCVEVSSLAGSSKSSSFQRTMAELRGLQDLGLQRPCILHLEGSKASRLRAAL